MGTECESGHMCCLLWYLQWNAHFFIEEVVERKFSVFFLELPVPWPRGPSEVVSAACLGGLWFCVGRGSQPAGTKGVWWGSSFPGYQNSSWLVLNPSRGSEQFYHHKDPFCWPFMPVPYLIWKHPVCILSADGPKWFRLYIRLSLLGGTA